MFMRIFNNLESVLCRIFLVIFVTLLFIQILSRQFFNYSFSWIEELSVYLFVWFAYFGASFAALKGAHNRVTFHLKKMTPKKRLTIEVFADATWVFFNVYFLWLAYKFVFFRMNKFWTSQTLDIPMKWVYMVLPITFVLMTIRIIQTNYKKIVLNEELEDPDKVDISTIHISSSQKSEK